MRLKKLRVEMGALVRNVDRVTGNRCGGRCNTRGVFRIAAATAATVLALAILIMWPAGEALAQCAPAAVGANPSNTTVNCNGVVVNQNAPDGYGTGLQINDAVNVQT